MSVWDKTRLVNVKILVVNTDRQQCRFRIITLSQHKYNLDSNNVDTCTLICCLQGCLTLCVVNITFYTIWNSFISVIQRYENPSLFSYIFECFGFKEITFFQCWSSEELYGWFMRNFTSSLMTPSSRPTTSPSCTLSYSRMLSVPHRRFFLGLLASVSTERATVLSW